MLNRYQYKYNYEYNCTTINRKTGETGERENIKQVPAPKKKPIRYLLSRDKLDNHLAPCLIFRWYFPVVKDYHVGKDYITSGPSLSSDSELEFLQLVILCSATAAVTAALRSWNFFSTSL